MIAPEKLLEAAKALEPQLQEWRRTLHRHPEVGFDLPQTKALVKKALTEMGYTPQDCGKCGVVALAGGKRPGKVILLRGDMDALPLQEESGEEFSSELPGKMHGCGHDMHTAMVLGAAKLLKEHEDEIEGTVKLEFQPAEEIFQGSLDMISSGLLENPKVDAAVMFHVLAGMPLPAGMVLVPGGGITMASCEQYHIVVHGKGGHGSMPNACIDPITAAAHIHIALQEINSRELDPAGFGVFTTGRFQAGAAAVGRHGDGVRAVCRPAAGRRRLHVQYHVQPLGVGCGDQIGQHVRAHHAPAQVRAALYDHGGQPALRRVQQRGAVVAQGFRLRHRRVAEHVGEIFQYLLAEPRRIGRQRQRQRRFPLADAPLQFHVKHSRLLLSGAPLIRRTSEAPYLFDCIL